MDNIRKTPSARYARLRSTSINRQPSSHQSARQRIPFTKDDWTSENESYHFSIDESLNDPWKRCFEVVDRADEELYKELKDEISWLLIVASLFLGIVTAFSSMSFGWIRVDDRKVSTALLSDIVKLLNNTDARGTVPPRDVTNLVDFHPQDSEIIVNQIWFLSMTLSLSAVVAGTLCLQWLANFRRKDLEQRPYSDALALRQLRFEGLMGWGVPLVPSLLLLAVQGAVVLFSIGLMFLLWSVNRRVAIPVVIVGGVVTLLLSITAVLPLLQSVAGWIFPSTLSIPQCPYKAPISWVIHRGCVLLSIIVTLPLSLLPRFGKILMWRGHQIELLRGYRWQAFDVLWRKQRECRGPQTSKSGCRKYSHYLVHGLGSAMEILVFQPNAIHIIQTCLRDVYGTTAEAEAFEDLFAKNTDVGKRALLEYNAIKEVVDGFEKSQLHLSVSHKNLKRDFLNAHALQYFASRNPSLCRALLSHRVELYIRIANSSRHFCQLDCGELGAGDLASAEKQYIGSSLECPIQTPRDAAALSLALQYQFLKCADRYLLDTNRHTESDIRGVESVLTVVKKVLTNASPGDDVDGPPSPLGDGMTSDPNMASARFAATSYHKRLSTASDDATEYGSVGENDVLLGQQGGSDDLRDIGSSPTIPSSSDLAILYENVLWRLRGLRLSKPTNARPTSCCTSYTILPY